MRCNQQGCEQPGAYRFTWPGHEEAAACEDHAWKIRVIANSMGLTLQLIPLSPERPDA